jgi:glycosyltransferase involved in cell wall biosynthesis
VDKARILVVAYGGVTTASSRLRILQYVPALRRAGLDIDTAFVPKGSPGHGRHHFAQKLEWADIVFVQRVLSRELLTALRQSGRVVVFDLDDAIHYIRPTQHVRSSTTLDARRRIGEVFRLARRGSRYYSGRKKLLDEMLGLSSTVIVGNSWLRHDLRLEDDRSLIIPTAVRVDRAPIKRHESHYPIILGWIGGGGSLDHLDLLNDAFETLRARFVNRVEVKVVSSRPHRTPLPTRFERWSLETEDDAVLSFDVGLMPLRDDPFSRGKCAFKAIYCMSRAIPVVASPVGANVEVIDHGVSGMLASTTSEWIDAISRLVDDAGLRAQLGASARATVEARYSAASAEARLCELLTSLAQPRLASRTR